MIFGFLEAILSGHWAYSDGYLRLLRHAFSIEVDGEPSSIRRWGHPGKNTRGDVAIDCDTPMGAGMAHQGGSVMCMVVGPVGFIGGEPLPAATARGNHGRYGVAVSSHEHVGDTPHQQADQPESAEAAMMDRFLSDYLDLMPGRLDTIRDFITRQRYEEARVAILSLESASGMVGESELRSLLHELRLCVDTCSDDRKHELITTIESAAEQVYARLGGV